MFLILKSYKNHVNNSHLLYFRSYKESLDTSTRNKEKEMGIGEELQPIIKPGCQVPDYPSCQAGGQHSDKDNKSANLADSTLNKNSDYNQTNDKLSSL